MHISYVINKNSIIKRIFIFSQLETEVLKKNPYKISNRKDSMHPLAEGRVERIQAVKTRKSKRARGREESGAQERKGRRRKQT